MSHGAQPTSNPFRQPKAVWAVAFACVISFMGIGLVDPILPALAHDLHATPSQVSLLFTSYLVVTALGEQRIHAVQERARRDYETRLALWAPDDLRLFAELLARFNGEPARSNSESS